MTKPEMSQPKRMLDLFCGRGGWTNEFMARGWECVGVDLVRHPDYRGEFVQADVLDIEAGYLVGFNFICASSPCEGFSVWGMRHFFPDPDYPKLGIELFNHTRGICEDAGIPYIMENVRAAQKFVGEAGAHCGPFYLWGSAIPLLVPQGIIKGMTRKAHGFREYKGEPDWNRRQGMGARNDKESAAKAATIPPELAHCVADYAERLLEAAMSTSER